MCKCRQEAVHVFLKYVMGRSGHISLRWTMDEIQAARKALVAFGYYVRGKFSHSGLVGEQFVETMC